MEPPASQERIRRSTASAWLVHLFTATGTVIAFLALTATMEGDYRLALLWLLIGLAIDGVDGSLARAARVGEALPRIDGDALDLIIDYLNYVFIPAIIIVRAGLVPDALALPLAALILVSALYNFTRRDMKTDDGYFRGFPALWNLVAFYFVVAPPTPAFGTAVICALAMLTFTSMTFVHPFRVTDFGRWPPALACLWAAATAALLWPDWEEGIRPALFVCSIGTAAILVVLGLVRSVRGMRRD